MTENLQKKKLRGIGYWCANHSLLCLCIGLVFIALGVCIEIVAPKIYKKEPLWAELIISNVSHFFLILGEVIVALFLLHRYVEESSHMEHFRIIKDSQDQFIDNINNIKNVTEQKFEALFLELDDKTDKLIDKIKHNIYQAFLSQISVPIIIEQMLRENTLKPTAIVTEYSINFRFLEPVNDYIWFEQTVTYKIKMTDVNDKLLTSDSHYKMPFSLLHTREIEYSYIESRWKYASDRIWCPLSLANFIEKPTTNNNHLYELRQPIKFNRQDDIVVCHRYKVKYLLPTGGVIHDHWHSESFITKIEIDIRSDGELKFEVNSTLQNENFPYPTFFGHDIHYESRNLIIPGQGLTFRIERLEKYDVS